MKKLLGSAVLSLMLMSVIGSAQDFSVGLAAAEAGDYDTALREWMPLAEQGDALAQSSLGGMYLMGRGVSKDYAEAMKWFRLAAEQGDALAQNSLGFMYLMGQSVPQDYAEAMKWYRLAAEQGDAFAQGSLGFMYLMGQSVPQDYISAHMWFNISSANGDSTASGKRDEIASKLLPADISEAQRRAKVCMASSYQDCD